MNGIFSPEFIQLLEGVKPYLGSDGKSLAESISKILNTVSSQPVREAVEEVSNLLPQLSDRIGKPLSKKLKKPLLKKRVKPVAADGEDIPSGAPVTETSEVGIQGFFGGNFAFVLFLILILLFWGDP